MPIAAIDDLGALGVNTKLPAHELPPNTLTYALNCRATIGGIESVNNYSDDMSFAPFSGAFSLAQYTKRDGTRYWISATATKVYAHNGTTNVAIRDTSISTVTAAQGWDLINFNGVLVANPSTGTPYYWTGNSHTTDAMGALTAWPAGMKARLLRPFKNFLVAMNFIDYNGTTSPRPNLVQWSHSADPDTVPDSWDPTDDTKDAGFFPLADTGGAIMEAEQLNGDLIIYKDDCVWRMAFTGSQQIFRFTPITQDFGALGKNCVASFPGGHLVLTSDSDVVIHDGSGKWVSILQDSNRTLVENRLTPVNSPYAFVQRHPRFNEIWICLPQETAVSSTYPCDFALVYNYLTGSIVFRELPQVYAGCLGVTISASGISGDIWDGDTETWSDDYTLGDENTVDSKDGRDLVMMGYSALDFYKMDVFSPTVKQLDMHLERTDLAIDGKKINGAFRVDTTMRKLVTDLWPVVEIDGEPSLCKIRVGGREGLKNPVIWEAEATFRNESYVNITEPTVDDSNNSTFADGLRVSCLVNTPLIAWAFRTGFTLGTYGKVRIQGYSMDLKPCGRTI